MILKGGFEVRGLEDLLSGVECSSMCLVKEALNTFSERRSLSSGTFQKISRTCCCFNVGEQAALKP